MKFDRSKITLCLVIMLLMPVLAFCNKTSSADTYYAKGQYKEAAAGYQKIVNEGYQSATIFYNLGNAYYKSGDIASALLYYEKAHRLSPADDDINFNIRFANSKTVDKIDEAPEFFLAKWWKGAILAISADTLAAIAVILVLLGSGALILYFFSNAGSIKKASFFSALALFLLGIFSIFIAGSQWSYFNNNKQAIIFTSVVNVKSSPAEQASTVFVLHDGTKVNISNNNNGWIKIKLANGNEGWLKQADVKVI